MHLLLCHILTCCLWALVTHDLGLRCMLFIYDSTQYCKDAYKHQHHVPTAKPKITAHWYVNETGTCLGCSSSMSVWVYVVLKLTLEPTCIPWVLQACLLRRAASDTRKLLGRPTFLRCSLSYLNSYDSFFIYILLFVLRRLPYCLV